MIPMLLEYLKLMSEDTEKAREYLDWVHKDREKSARKEEN